MRVGVVAPPVAALGWNEWRDVIGRADRLGVDAVLLRSGEGSDQLLTAAALADATSWMRVVAEVNVAPGLHPVHLAERIAVADQCLAGRLIVVLRRVNEDDVSLFIETLDVLELALASRPFSYQGMHWTIPARLPANDEASWSQLSVTPTPAQFEFPLWLAGSDLAELARERRFVWLAEGSARWTALLASPDNRVGLRPLIHDWVGGAEGGASVTATATKLTDEQRVHGVDLAFLPLLEGGVDRLEEITTLIRPRVQLSELPAGIEAFWETSLPADSLEP